MILGLSPDIPLRKQEHKYARNQKNYIVDVILLEIMLEIALEMIFKYGIGHTYYHPYFKNYYNNRHIYAGTHISSEKILVYIFALLLKTETVRHPFHNLFHI